jgi:hypothetical protein
LTVETFHEDFGGGFVDCEEERRMWGESDPFNEGFCCEGCFHCIVMLIVGICETREGELERCHFLVKKLRTEFDKVFIGLIDNPKISRFDRELDRLLHDFFEFRSLCKERTIFYPANHEH